MLEWIQNNGEHLLAIIGGLFTLAFLVVRLTPTKKDDEFVERAYPVVRGIALLFGLRIPGAPVVPTDALPPKIVPLEPPSPPPAERNHKTGRAHTEALAVVVLLALLLAGCASAGDQYQASSMAFVVAGDTATGLRKAGKLDEKAIDEIGLAVDDGHAILGAWSEALKAGQDYPDGTRLVSVTVERIRAHLRARRE